MSREDYNYKRHAIQTAKDLCYSDNVIAQLKSAKTESEIQHIMMNARKGNY